MDISQIRRLKTKLLLLMEMHEEMGGGKEEKMSVLVKGMEMPKTCNDCPLLDWDLSYIKCGVVNRKFEVDEEHFRESRVYDCPLIEIPPHGDLVDINRLKVDVINQEYSDNASADLIKVFRLINTAPTIIPADGGET